MLTFQDIFKSSFLENAASVSLFDMALALLLSFGLGMFIFLIYKKTFSGVMYSSSFGVTLVALTMITTLVILAVTSKEPLDIAFLFWAIAAGIVLAAGLIPLAVAGSVCVGAVLLALVNRKSHLDPYIMVLRCEGGESETAARSCLERSVKRLVVKSKTVQAGEVELQLELRLLGEDTGFVNTLASMEGVRSAALVSYNGDYMG